MCHVRYDADILMHIEWLAAFGLNSVETRFFVRVLRCTALPILGLLFYFAHGYLADFLMDVSFVPNVDMRHFLLLAGSLVAPIVVALAFAFPIAALFPRHAVVASLIICFPSLKISIGHAFQNAQKPFWFASSVIAVVAIGLLVPYAAAHARSLLKRANSAPPGPTTSA